MSGHALRYTKGNESRNIKPRAVLPTTEDVAILRRCAAGYIIVTMIDGKPQYTYEDGSPVTLRPLKRRTAISHDDGERNFARLVREGWLIGDKGDCLFQDNPQPQIYRARKL